MTYKYNIYIIEFNKLSNNTNIIIKNQYKKPHNTYILCIT